MKKYKRAQEIHHKNPIIQALKRTYFFLFEEDSAISWVVSVLVAYIAIKFLIYPGLGLVLGTQFPIVAVVSGSMEHHGNFDSFWRTQGDFYDKFDISKEEFMDFRFKNGFNKGDIMVLGKAKNIKVGDVIVFRTPRSEPIIHRVIKITHLKDGSVKYQTKGDANPMSIVKWEFDETNITKDMLLGKANIRIPLLGWIKIAFVDLLKFVGVNVR